MQHLLQRGPPGASTAQLSAGIPGASTPSCQQQTRWDSAHPHPTVLPRPSTHSCQQPLLDPAQPTPCSPSYSSTAVSDPSPTLEDSTVAHRAHIEDRGSPVCSVAQLEPQGADASSSRKLSQLTVPDSSTIFSSGFPVVFLDSHFQVNEVHPEMSIFQPTSVVAELTSYPEHSDHLPVGTAGTLHCGRLCYVSALSPQSHLHPQNCQTPRPCTVCV